jgi:hypothetical protein
MFAITNTGCFRFPWRCSAILYPVFLGHVTEQMEAALLKLHAESGNNVIRNAGIAACMCIMPSLTNSTVHVKNLLWMDTFLYSLTIFAEILMRLISCVAHCTKERSVASEVLPVTVMYTTKVTTSP